MFRSNRLHHTVPVVRLSLYNSLFVWGLATAGCVLFAACLHRANAQDVPTASQMNVLFIAVDDMRVELGCYGSPIVQSPHLDGLAERSLVFDRAYCQQSVCNPSRASMLTGLRLDTLGIGDLETHFRQRDPSIVTLPQLFKNNDYQAHGIGKIFHNFRQDEFQGDRASWSVEQQLHYGNHNKNPAEVEGVLPADQAGVARAERRDVPDDAYWDGQIADLAVERLRELRGEPFFLGVGFWKPHLPFNAPAKYWDQYDFDQVGMPVNPLPPENVPALAMHDGKELMRNFPDGLTDDQVRLFRHGYYAAISYVDAQIGKVLDELDRLGLRESTIVVFWSDHGFHLGEHDLWCKTSNFELDARVPLMISVPGSPSQAQRTDALVELLDVYPTLAELCGLTPPDNLEGLSMQPILDDPRATIHDAVLTQHPRPPYAQKNRPFTEMGYSIRTPGYRYTQWLDLASGNVVATELYDHGQDPLETVNLSGRDNVAAIERVLAKKLEGLARIDTFREASQ